MPWMREEEEELSGEGGMRNKKTHLVANLASLSATAMAAATWSTLMIFLS